MVKEYSGLQHFAGIGSPYSKSGTYYHDAEFGLQPSPAKDDDASVSLNEIDIELGLLNSQKRGPMKTIDDKLTRNMSRISFEQAIDDHLLNDQSAPDPAIMHYLQRPTQKKTSIKSTPRGESVQTSLLSSSSSSSNSISSNGSDHFGGSGSSDSETSKHFYQRHSLSDEESLNSEQRMVVENLLPHRKFGGHGEGQLRGSIMDGFADYRIYIKLLSCELKILMLPLYLQMTRM